VRGGSEGNVLLFIEGVDGRVVTLTMFSTVVKTCVDERCVTNDTNIIF